MKIGTLTYHQANNYGAVLQAYALQRYLLNIGIDAEIIDYRPNLGSVTQNQTFANRMLHYLLKPDLYIKNRIRRRKFNDFRNKYLNLSSITFIGDEAISKSPPKYDLYIVGSDQVWNTDISNKSKAYFLNFVNNGYKISYAASLGKEEFNETEKEYVKKYLTDFYALSTRESLLQKNLKDEFCIDSEQVLDPVFLIEKENWLEISTRIRLPENYVLCYMLEFSRRLIDYTKEVARKLNCFPVFISPSYSNFYGRKLKGIGPPEFLYTIANASFICTNSFHGTAFSIIFEKNFTVFKHSKLNSRIEDIINKAGLKDRFYSINDYNNIECINYKTVNENMEVYVNKSKQFITNISKNINC